MRVLLITPPFTQLNTPYPATACLSAWLRGLGCHVRQADLSLETACALFSRRGIERFFQALEDEGGALPEPVRTALARSWMYIETIDAVMRFLQGREPTLAHRIANGNLLPEGPRFLTLDDDEWAFGALGQTERARHLCTLYLDDLTDFIRATVDPDFGLSRYAERIAVAATSFEPILRRIQRAPGFVEGFLMEQLSAHLADFDPAVVGITVPFPGNLFGALRSAQLAKAHNPRIKVVLGGGYINTELRRLQDPRIFDWVDFITFDDGERPLECLVEYLNGERPEARLCRTMIRRGDRVRWVDGEPRAFVPHRDVPAPSYRDLPLEAYPSLLEVLNPVHRLWSDGRWIKMTLAHGCYWKQCAFCDVELDYIGRYDPADASILVDRMETLIGECGQSGFHFVDEAAPPLLLRELALEILSRNLVVSWWGNIRFEKTFDPELCRLLAASGCVAVSGGLEVASDRLLKRMKKGVSVEQVARVAAGFTRAGVMVHAYLMYGFPTQCAQEYVDSLELVRQLFAAGLIHSAFWHRFVATAHSPVGRHPERFDIRITGPEFHGFAFNDLAYTSDNADHEDDPADYGPALEAALHAFMEGACLDESVLRFFSHPVPAPSVSPTFVQDALARMDAKAPGADRAKVPLWLGGMNAPMCPLDEEAPRRGSPEALLCGRDDYERFGGPAALGEWLRSFLSSCTPARQKAARAKLRSFVRAFPGGADAFEAFGRSRTWRRLRELGLLLV